ncbi:MAG: hypothetical protein FJX57_14590, partial [Alphaproteobacteria bacterium]|nr:hypothetical protein [Alphaproteobacteria bacterium]
TGPRRGPALILVAHGAQQRPTAGTALRRLAAQLREHRGTAAVEVAYLHAEPGLASVLAALAPAGPVCVVPMFAADGAHARAAVEATIAETRRRHPRSVIRRVAALGQHLAYVGSLARRLHALVDTAAITPGRADFVAIGHGSRRAGRPPEDAARRLAESQRGVFATSQALYIDGEPSAAQWSARTACRDVVVAPIFFSDARHAGVDVPALFGRPQSIPAITDRLDGPWLCEGRRVWSALLPPSAPCVADLVLDLALRGTIDGSARALRDRRP